MNASQCLQRATAALGFALAVMSGPAVAAGQDDAPGCPRAAAPQDMGALSRVVARIGAHETVRVLALGSSSTEGAGASSPSRAYPVRLEIDLETMLRGTGIDVVNAGRGGETAPQTLDRLPALLARRSFDLVIWQVGTNDAVKGAEEEVFLRQLRRGIDLVRRSGADLILMDQQYLADVADPARYARFVGLVAREAKAERVPLFSRYAMMRAWAQGRSSASDEMLAADHFHMNDRGYACLAESLAASIAHQVHARSAGAS